MKVESITVSRHGAPSETVPVTWVNTLVIGSGAAGLCAAVQLRKRGVDDLLIVTEGLAKGTSINTGSDKQTYYKLSLCDADSDSPREMAETYFNGHGMHGDIALAEAANSMRAFMHLADLGVPFPTDAYGQFVGYKTDHDPRRRATSIGPYTSKRMCEALIEEVRRLNIEVLERRHCVRLLVIDDPSTGEKRAVGALVIDEHGRLEAYTAENTVFAVGGPGGLYKTSVYPPVHAGAIGLALREGALARNLPESQFGLASIKFRWNVSGTYMQVVPRFVSTDADGESNPREFMPEYFDAPGEMFSNVFLKGYQWPFDARKAVGGSSLVDILVYIETVVRGRRVFLDFREDPEGFAFDQLSDEAREYLEKSDALLGSPIARLEKMNPGAIGLYADHGIDLRSEPLEVAVCAQHNNGGLAANAWWESVNIRRLFPIGEVNGSHGVYRPGGSALNAGQVGAMRAAEYIAMRGAGDLSTDETLHPTVMQKASEAAADVLEFLHRSGQPRDETEKKTWQEHRLALQQRMSKAGAHIRDRALLDQAIAEAREQCGELESAGAAFDGECQKAESLQTRQLALAHLVYLEAIRYAVESGVGSRGSAIVLDPNGQPVHDRLGDSWRMSPENEGFRSRTLETRYDGQDVVANEWTPCRKIPESDTWFETAWAAYREGRIYDDE